MEMEKYLIAVKKIVLFEKWLHFKEIETLLCMLYLAYQQFKVTIEITIKKFLFK